MDDQQETEERLPDELEELQRALKSLEPLPGRADRGRLIYLAGRASAGVAPGTSDTSAGDVPTRNWAWPASTAAMTLVAATLAVMLAVRPQPQPRIVRETVYVKQPAHDVPDVRRPLVFDPTPRQPASADEPGMLTAPYLGMNMRQTVLEQGADALPDVVLTRIDPPSTSRQMLENLLDGEPESGTRNGEGPGPIEFDWKSFVFPGETL